ncbi:MAG: 6-bladed beta-propeller [Bacteroidales bacterium]
MRRIFILTAGMMVILVTSSWLLQQNRKRSDYLRFLEIIDVGISLKNPRPVYASSIFSDIRYIELESTEEIYIRGIRDVKVSGDNIIVVTNRHEILRFNKGGKFVNSIGRPGRGPGEYNTPFVISILEKQQKLALLETGAGNRLHLFGLDGKNPVLVKTPGYCSDVTGFGDNLLLWSLIVQTPLLENHSACIIDMRGKVAGYLLPKVDNVPLKPPFISLGSIEMYRMSDSLSVWEANIDTLYRIENKNTAFPRYVIRAGKDYLTYARRMSTNDSDRSLRNRSVYFNGLIETKQWIFLSSRVKGEQGYFIYSKKDKQVTFLEPLSLLDGMVKYNGIMNDIDGGPVFWPMGRFSETELYFTGRFNSYRSHFSRIAKIPDPFRYNEARHKELAEKVSNSDPNDNPCIVVVRLK